MSRAATDDARIKDRVTKSGRSESNSVTATDAGPWNARLPRTPDRTRGTVGTGSLDRGEASAMQPRLTGSCAPGSVALDPAHGMRLLP